MKLVETVLAMWYEMLELYSRPSGGGLGQVVARVEDNAGH